MNDALVKVLLSRERILQRVAQQRGSVVTAFGALARPIALVDRLVSAGRVLMAHPAVVVVLVAGVFVLRARTLIGLVGRGIGIWRLFHRIGALVGRFSR